MDLLVKGGGLGPITNLDIFSHRAQRETGSIPKAMGVAVPGCSEQTSAVAGTNYMQCPLPLAYRGAIVGQLFGSDD